MQALPVGMQLNTSGRTNEGANQSHCEMSRMDLRFSGKVLGNRSEIGPKNYSARSLFVLACCNVTHQLRKNCGAEKRVDFKGVDD